MIDGHVERALPVGERKLKTEVNGARPWQEFQRLRVPPGKEGEIFLYPFREGRCRFVDVVDVRQLVLVELEGPKALFVDKRTKLVPAACEPRICRREPGVLVGFGLLAPVGQEPRRLNLQEVVAARA